MIVDCAAYQEGVRLPGELPIGQAFTASCQENAFVWIGLHEPTEEEFDAVRLEFELHELAVEDAITAHQRPKLETYGDCLLVVLKLGGDAGDRAWRDPHHRRRRVHHHRPTRRGGAPCDRRPDRRRPSPYFRDAHDHVLRGIDQIEGHRDVLTSVLTANLTQVTVRQNEDVRRISAWAAILAVPTMIAGLYGMNFRNMPELGWRHGYPLVVGLIVTACFTVWRYFRRIGWL